MTRYLSVRSDATDDRIRDHLQPTIAYTAGCLQTRLENLNENSNKY